MGTDNTRSMGLAWPSALVKRAFDILVSFTGLILAGWLIVLAWLVAASDTRSNGFFIQSRIGRGGKLFPVIKIKTMYPRSQIGSTVTTVNDARISRSGYFFRRTKIDELPQLINVLVGQMSLVGPRPDVPGFADLLQGDDCMILSVRPGITSPATIKYRDEETLLAQQNDPEQYNRDVIFPDKVRINREYVENYSFWKDLYYIWKTVFN